METTKQPGMTNPFPTQKSSWFKRPWNLVGLALVLIATVFIVISYATPVINKTTSFCSCNQIEGAGFKFDSIWLLFVAGALFMDTPLRGLVSRLRGNSQSVQTPETPAAQQQTNKDA